MDVGGGPTVVRMKMDPGGPVDVATAR